MPVSKASVEQRHEEKLSQAREDLIERIDKYIGHLFSSSISSEGVRVHVGQPYGAQVAEGVAALYREQGWNVRIEVEKTSRRTLIYMILK